MSTTLPSPWRKMTEDDHPVPGTPFLGYGYNCVVDAPPVYFVGFVEAPPDLFGRPHPMRIRVRAVSIPNIPDLPGYLWQGNEQQCREHPVLPLSYVHGWMPLPAVPTKPMK